MESYTIVVNLRTGSGEIVGYLEIPRFNPLPSFLFFKNRLFKFVSKIDYHEYPVYRVPDNASFDEGF